MIDLAALKTLGDGLHEAVICVAADTFTIEYANAAAEALSGFCRAELCDRPLLSLVPTLSAEIIQSLIISPDAHPLDLSGELITRDGGRETVRIHLSRVVLDGKAALLCSLQSLPGRESAAALLRAQRDLALALSAENDLERALGLIVDTAARLSRMDGGGVYLFDAHTGDLLLHYHTGGLPDEFVHAVARLSADSLQARLVRQGTPLYLPFKQLYERMRSPMDDVHRRAGIGAIAVVPLVSGQEVIGALNIFSRARRALSPAVRHTLEALASQAANAIARIRAEQARRAHEHIVRTLLNAIPDTAVLLDRHLAIQAVNEAGAQFLGVPAQTLIGKPLLENVPVAVALLFTEQINRVFGSGQPVQFVYDGCDRVLSVSIYPLPDANGEVEQVALYGRDITGQYLNQLALNRQRALLQAVAQATSHLLTNPDLDAAIEQALAVLGEASVADWLYIFRFTTEDETGDPIACLSYHWARKGTAHLFNWNDLYLQHIPLRGRERLLDYLRRGEAIDTDDLIWREHAEVDTFLAQGHSALFLPLWVAGELWGVIGFGHHKPAVAWNAEDRIALHSLANSLGGAITRSLTTRRLHQELNLSETLRDIGTTITATLDLQSVLARILEQVQRLVSYDTASIFLVEEGEAQMVSRRVVGLGHFPRSTRAERVCIAEYPLLRRLVETGAAVVASDTYRHPQWRVVAGTEYIRSWLGVPIISKSQVTGFLVLHSTQPGFYRPEHAHMVAPLATQAGIALQNARLFADVQRLERTKSEMIRIASHDLRNPLTRLSMLTNRLLDLADLTARPAVERDLVRMRDTIAEMEHLIDDILSLERIEARHRNSELVDWCALVRQAIDALQPEIAARGHQLSLQCPEELPHLYGDPAQLYHAIYNLLHNAIKYTPAGGYIEVRARQGHHTDQATLVFEVEDNGIGISPEQQQALFQPFFRTGNATAPSAPGVGLGLTVVKAAVEAHQGRVYCESTPGQGSLFGFWVPLNT